MRTYDPMIYNAALSAEAGAGPLTDGQKQILRDEIASDPKGRGYAGKSAEEILWLLGNEYYEPNPEPQGRVPITEWNRDELYNVLLQSETPQGVPLLIALEGLKAHQDPQIAGLATQALLTINAPLKAVNLENPKVAQGFTALKQIGVLSEELYQYITTKPDPSYQPTLGPKRRLWELFGDGALVTIDEIREAIA